MPSDGENDDPVKRNLTFGFLAIWLHILYLSFRVVFRQLIRYKIIFGISIGHTKKLSLVSSSQWFFID